MARAKPPAPRTKTGTKTGTKARSKTPAAAAPAPRTQPRKAVAPARAGMVTSWEKLRAIALSLDLPNVVETTSWGQPTLKAHGKLWAWWSPSEDAPVFKVPREEREIMIEADPDTFFVTPHYAPHGLVLVRPARCDAEWAKAMLLRNWREMAPKRVLKAYDAGRGG